MSRPASLALARLLQVTPREALRLMEVTRVLPFELDAAGVEGACTALRKHGLEVQPVEVPPTSSRCPAHPSLTGDLACDDCRTLVCPLCAPYCLACTARRASRARWKRGRVAVLLVVLFGVAGFGALRQRALARRTEWTRPLRVSVTLASPGTPDPSVIAAWRDGLASLDAWFRNEAERRGLRLEQPVHFELAPVTVEGDVPLPPDAARGEWLSQSQAALSFRSRLEAIAARGAAQGTFDVQLVVALRERAAHRVEGLGEAGGTVGLVEGNAGDTELTLELVAVAHELLHCLGAKDAYDEHGHALPRGIVEPELGFPQRFAEVMVGEVPLGPTEGRVPKSLGEVRIGDQTAQEVGW
jgi:hypothetical protein